MYDVAEILGRLDDIRSWQEDLYRHLHAHPELSRQEHATAALVARDLREWGYEVLEHVGGTGVVGVLENGPGRTVLVRADMDALPVREATGLDYASTVTAVDATGATVPVMHACGHDVHVSCLLSAARLLAAARSAWSGTFAALFQPDEELVGGAQAMIDDGLAAAVPRPDVALAQHVLPLPAGTVWTRPGPVLSSADTVRITLTGRGAHGSMPQDAVDPVVLAAAVVLRLQTLVSRETSPHDFACLTVGRLAAGSAANIIPERAELEISVRTYEAEVRRRLLDGLERVVTAECRASDAPTPPRFEYSAHCRATVNDPRVTAIVAEAFGAHFGAAASELERQTASEDFAVIADGLGAPYTYWGLGGIDPGLCGRASAAGRLTTDVPVLHSPHFAPVIRPTLATGTEAIVVATLACLRGG
ncbi:MAG: amidohydrolase [Acidobacteriota bacterium]|nr:amidohydrolase [Acidobacteriota bacterium]